MVGAFLFLLPTYVAKLSGTKKSASKALTGMQGCEPLPAGGEITRLLPRSGFQSLIFLFRELKGSSLLFGNGWSGYFIGDGSDAGIGRCRVHGLLDINIRSR